MYRPGDASGEKSIHGVVGSVDVNQTPGGGHGGVLVEEVRERILAVNRPTAPVQILDGRDEGVDLIAEWKIVDARWYEIFVKAGLEKVFRILPRFDAAAHEVRAKEHEYSLSWSAGVPDLELSGRRFSGQKQFVQFGTA